MLKAIRLAALNGLEKLIADHLKSIIEMHELLEGDQPEKSAEIMAWSEALIEKLEGHRHEEAVDGTLTVGSRNPMLKVVKHHRFP